MRGLRWFGCLVLVAAFAACEEDVNPIVGTDLPFTFYGVLTPEADTQWVRVFPIEERLDPSTAPAIDAVVYSTDQQTGERIPWTFRLLTADDEGPLQTYGYFYWAAFRPAYGRSYRVDVERSDGRAAHATAAVPERSELEVLPMLTTQTSTARVLIRGRADHFINVWLTFDIKYGVGEHEEQRLRRRFEGTLEQTADGWVLPINLGLAQNEIEEYLRDNQMWSNNYGVSLRRLSLRLLATDPAWDPPGDGPVFDPNVLVEPNQMTNVVNGFGFVGAGYSLAVDWLPEEELLLNAGFAVHATDTTRAAL